LGNSEIENLQNVVRSQDLNADGIVTMAEIQSVRADDANASMGMKSMLIAADSAVALATDQKPRKAAAKILDHYTSLGSMSREQWSGWNDQRWNTFDTDGDQEISVGELESITTVAPDLEIKIQFPVDSNAPLKLAATVRSESELLWASRLTTAGQATGTPMTLGINVSDSYAAASKAALRAQIAAVLTNPQLETAVRNQLQLKEGAFDILDADNDDKLSDSEFENAWDWLTAIRGSRVQARWMLAESAWFRMADADADSRLTEVEVQKLPAFLARLDRDKDGVVSPTEIPLTVRLEITRTDAVLNLGSLVQPEDSGVERGWFAASDSNNDNSISKAEFLGTLEDFQGYDTDNDGFISATEAYKSPSARVQ
jgi:Ca2+-binding EF-hand superfamily protein